MHPHTILMLAAVGVVALFVVVVVVVTALARRGRLGDAQRRLSFDVYGPRVAASFAAGAVVVHLGVVADHALRTSLDPAGSAVSFLCSIGAASHVTAPDSQLLGYAPLGVASLALIPPEAALAVPRLWRRPGVMLAGLTVCAASILLVVVSRATFAGTAQADGHAVLVSAGFEIVVAVVAVLLLRRRPERVLAGLRMTAIDAHVATGLAIVTAAAFAIAGLTLVASGH